MMHKVFPNKLEMLRFFGSYLPKMDVATSARMPPFMYAYDGKTMITKNLFGFLAEMAEMADLKINVNASVQRGGTFILFFDGEIKEPAPVQAEPTPQAEVISSVVTTEETTDTKSLSALEIAALVEKARALYDEADKRGSKEKLVALGAEHGITLNKSKTFETMVADLEAALSE